MKTQKVLKIILRFIEQTYNVYESISFIAFHMLFVQLSMSLIQKFKQYMIESTTIHNDSVLFSGNGYHHLLSQPDSNHIQQPVNTKYKVCINVPFQSVYLLWTMCEQLQIVCTFPTKKTRWNCQTNQNVLIGGNLGHAEVFRLTWVVLMNVSCVIWGSESPKTYWKLHH